MINKTTILVEKSTRDTLKQLGTKGQSYDKLINWLIQKKDSLEIKDSSEE
jgi:hypothetical protein